MEMWKKILFLCSWAEEASLKTYPLTKLNLVWSYRYHSWPITSHPALHSAKCYAISRSVWGIVNLTKQGVVNTCKICPTIHNKYIQGVLQFCIHALIIWRELTEASKNLGVDTFPDPISHFGPPWWPFLISKVLVISWGVHLVRVVGLLGD